MRNLIFKFLIVAMSIIIVDRLVGYGLERLYFSQKGEDYRYATKAIDEQESDFIILGSSRARNHYNASLIGESLGMSVYNCGRSGHFMVYQSAQLDMILDRYTPKIVLLDVTPYDLEGSGDEDEYDKLGSLLPYDSHASYHSILRKRSWYEPIKALSKTYRYNSKLLKLLNNLNVVGNGGFHEDGFQPVDGVLVANDTILGEAGNTCGRISSNMLREFEHIIDVCGNRGIYLVVVISPFHAHYARTATIAATDSLCAMHGIPYRSWLNAPQFNDSGLYFTIDHLNSRGADLYSKEVVEWLKQCEI